MAQRWADIRAVHHRRVRRGKRAVRVNNATMANKTAASGGGAIHCVVCINRNNFKDDPRGVTVVKGYAACPDHVDLVSRPGFDVQMLNTGNAGRTV